MSFLAEHISKKGKAPMKRGLQNALSFLSIILLLVAAQSANAKKTGEKIAGKAHVETGPVETFTVQGIKVVMRGGIDRNSGYEGTLVEEASLEVHDINVPFQVGGFIKLDSKKERIIGGDLASKVTFKLGKSEYTLKKGSRIGFGAMGSGDKMKPFISEAELAGPIEVAIPGVIPEKFTIAPQVRFGYGSVLSEALLLKAITFKTGEFEAQMPQGSRLAFGPLGLKSIYPPPQYGIVTKANSFEVKSPIGGFQANKLHFTTVDSKTSLVQLKSITVAEEVQLTVSGQQKTVRKDGTIELTKDGAFDMNRTQFK